MSHPARCYCKRAACRKGRPLCRRTDNPRNITCNCPGLWFPHRIGSGSCYSNPRSTERMNLMAYGPESAQ